MISHGYATLCGFTGEVLVRDGDVTVWEARPEMRYYLLTGSGVETVGQPPLGEIARFFETFWTGGEPLPADNGLYLNRHLDVLKVTVEQDRVRVTTRAL